MKKIAMRVCDRKNLVAEIIEGVEANNLKIVTEAINKNKNYALAKTQYKKIARLVKKSVELNEKIGEEERELTELVRTINDTLPIQWDEKDRGGEAHLSFESHNSFTKGGLKIKSHLPYAVRDRIERRVAIDTMMSYCQDDILTIIENLTKEFSGGTK
tara:strand:+ start:187 stop:660 length:474 start_codon:yes stop_codon:yes gene_type:complete